MKYLSFDPVLPVAMNFCVFNILSTQGLIGTQNNTKQQASIPLMDSWRPDYWKVAEPKPINT